VEYYTSQSFERACRTWQHAVLGRQPEDKSAVDYDDVFRRLGVFIGRDGPAARQLAAIKPAMRNHALDANRSTVSNDVPLVAYPHRQTRKGVSVEVNRGKRTLIKGAFVATMRTGTRASFGARARPGRRSRKCPNAIESARTWRTKNGKPSRTAKAAHFGDVFGYAVWRLFPRRGVPSKLLDDALPPDAEVLTRDRGEGYGGL
jgi:hypothetical protein